MLKKLLKSKFLSSGIWYTIGNMLIKGIVFLSLPIFTRLLSPEDFGYYNTYIAYQSIMSVVVGLGLSGCIKNAKIDYCNSYNEFVTSILSLDFIFLIVSVLVLNVVSLLFLKNNNLLFNNILLITSSASTLIDIISAKWIIELKYKKYIATAFCNTFLNISLSIVFIKYVFKTQKYWGRIIGESIPLILIGIIIVAYMVKKNKKIYELEYWKYALKIGIPLIPHMLSKILLIQFDRIMLNNITGAAATGIYSCMYNLSSILNVLLNSFDMVWIAWLYPKMANKDYKTVKNMTKMYTTFFSIICVCVSLVIPEVVKIFVSKDYWDGIDVLFLLIYVVYINFIYLFFVNVQFYYKDTVFSSIGTILAAVVNIIINFCLIPEYGYMGAAIATIISYLVLSIAHYIIYKIRYKIDVVSVRTLVMSVFVIAFMLMFIYMLREDFIIRYVLLLIIGVISCIMIYRKVKTQ